MIKNKKTVDMKYKYFLNEICETILERALEAAKEKRQEKNEDLESYNFKSGRSMAYYEVVDFIKTEANIWKIPLKEIKMDKVNPDKDLL